MKNFQNLYNYISHHECINTYTAIMDILKISLLYNNIYLIPSHHGK